VIFAASDWTESLVGYSRTFYDIDRWGMCYVIKKEEIVDMSIPRPCTYSSKTDYDGDVKETTILEAPPEYHSSSEPPVECKGITLRQLRAVWANVALRCVSEGWKDYKGNFLVPHKITLYDVNKYVIKLFTAEQEISFVEAFPLTSRQQLPRFYISHWWGEPLIQFIQILEQAILYFRVICSIYDEKNRGGGMTPNTPVWVCAYSNKQWAPRDDIGTGL